MGEDRVIGSLRAANRIVGYVIGVLLMLVAAFILLEILLRKTGGVIGGTDEISGYMTAIVASWGFAFALVEQAHVRIDLVQRKTPDPVRAAMDCLALGATAAIALVVLWFGWDVLSKTLASDARANTPLETPLWIPQTAWYAGWVWFALNAAVLTVVSVTMLFRGRFTDIENNFGARGEVEEAEEQTK